MAYDRSNELYQLQRPEYFAGFAGDITLWRTRYEDSMTADEYRKQFAANVITPKDFTSFADRAIVTALDTRKFEISLYWQQTAYLWVMIAAAFAGYFAVDADKKPLAALCLACVGFVLSVAWYRLNQGSKFWQENWEQHVALLECEHFGPLFGAVIHRDSKPLFGVISPSVPISVTKVNLLVRVYVAFVWLALIAFQVWPLRLEAPVDWFAVVIVSGSAIASYGLWRKVDTKTGSGGVTLTKIDAP